jgi:hypothetical protein
MMAQARFWRSRLLRIAEQLRHPRRKVEFPSISMEIHTRRQHA